MPFMPYASRVNNGIVPLAQRAGGTNAVGEALTLLGRTVGQIDAQDRQTAEQVKQIDHEIAMRQDRNAREDAKVSGAVAMAEAQGRLRIFEETHQATPDFAQKYAAEVDRELSGVRQTIGQDEEVVQVFAEPLARFAATEKANAEIYTIRARAKAQGQSLDAAVDTFANSTTPDQIGHVFSVVDGMIDGLGSVDAAAKPAMKREARSRILTPLLSRTIAGGQHEAVAKALTSGTYDTVLEPNQKDGLLRMVEAQRTSLRVEEESRVSAQRKQLGEEKSAVQALIQGGVDVDPDRIANLARNYAAMGEKGEATQMAVLQTQASINRSYGRKSLAEQQAAISHLEAKAAAGKANAQEQIALKQLRTLTEKRQDDDVKPLKEAWHGGLQGRFTVAQQLAALPARERFDKAERVDKGLGAIVMLHPSVQDIALRGEDDLPAVEKHFATGVAQREFDAALGVAGREFAMTDQMEAAKRIYAYRARRAGITSFDKQLFTNSVSEALGGVRTPQGWKGGLGDWQGQRVILPVGVSQRGFTAAIQQQDFSKARLRGGAAVSKADILAHYAPVMVGRSDDGQRSLYEWRDKRGEPLLGPQGGRLITTVAP